MCTVSFLPLGEQLVFTSNRDEALARPLAFAPAYQDMNGKTLLFPKDPKAGGTWFSIANDGTIAVLLNGAFVRHAFGGVYRKSRGLVLLDIIASIDPFAAIDVYDLDSIEPFTLLLFKAGNFVEFRWDGMKKYIKALSDQAPCIYSSATLYDPPVILQREKWFEEFLNNGLDKTPQSIRDFHGSAGRGDASNGLVMSRGTFLKTQCITQAILTHSEIDFYHHDLIKSEEHNNVLSLKID